MPAQYSSILLSPIRSNRHHYSRHNKLRVYLLAEEKDGEQRTDEWCESVVGAGAGGTNRALGVGVEIDTQTVRHKAQEQQDKHVLPRRKGIVLR